jgi:hypothetical protein
MADSKLDALARPVKATLVEAALRSDVLALRGLAKSAVVDQQSDVSEHQDSARYLAANILDV